MLSALATFGEAHFLVYQSLNSLVSRDFLLDVLTFLLAVVSVSLVLKNSNKPIKLPTALTRLILSGLFEVSNLDFLVYWPFSRLQTSET